MRYKVSIEVFKHRLRLRWRYKGTRPTMALGLPDTPVTRRMAQTKATAIELDLISGNYDPTLLKYRGDSAKHIDSGGLLTTVMLFQRFAKHGSADRSKDGAAKYASVLGKLQRFGSHTAELDADTAESFRAWLGQRPNDITPATALEYLRILKACWEWGLARKLVKNNPWGDVCKRVKVNPKQKPKPFSPSEVTAILEGFRNSRHYAFYLDMVCFLLDTGCRTGEALALRWGHLDDDCGVVWIGQSMSHGTVRGTKTRRARKFRLSKKLQVLLTQRRSAGQRCGADDLVFPAKNGGAISSRTFRRGAWVNVLRSVGVPYRSPYKTRHTHITQQLKLGQKPMAIADRTGHDPEVLFRYYATEIDDGTDIPSLL